MDDPAVIQEILDFVRGVFGDLLANILLGAIAFAILVFAFWVIFHYLGALISAPIKFAKIIFNRQTTQEPPPVPPTPGNKGSFVITGDHNVVKGPITFTSDNRIHIGDAQELDELGLVVNAINEASALQPQGDETTVYISATNGLSRVYPEVLKGILLKLQEDGLLELRLFPDWLLSDTPLTIEVLDERVLASLHPQRKHFIVALKDVGEPPKATS